MSSGAKGLVLDTNVLISAAIFPHSMAARTLSLADFYRLMTQDAPL